MLKDMKDDQLSIKTIGIDANGCMINTLFPRHPENCTCGCTLFKSKQVFLTSPSIQYSAKFGQLTSQYFDRNITVKTAIAVRQNPKSYQIIKDDAENHQISHFTSSELLWFSGWRYPSIVPWALLIQIDF